VIIFHLSIFFRLLNENHRLMSSLLVWPKMITLSGFYCTLIMIPSTHLKYLPWLQVGVQNWSVLSRILMSFQPLELSLGQKRHFFSPMLLCLKNFVFEKTNELKRYFPNKFLLGLFYSLYFSATFHLGQPHTLFFSNCTDKNDTSHSWPYNEESNHIILKR